MILFHTYIIQVAAPKGLRNFELKMGKEFNAIEGFLGEGLLRNAYFASKMSWNFNTRNDAAIIGSPNGKHKYILVIFGDDPSFYKDKKLLPELSRMVYEQMTN